MPKAVNRNGKSSTPSEALRAALASCGDRAGDTVAQAIEDALEGTNQTVEYGKSGSLADAVFQLGRMLACRLESANVADSNGENANLVDTTQRMARQIGEVAGALNSLGIADSDTPMGAIELLSYEIKNGATEIAASINNLADAVRESSR